MLSAYFDFEHLEEFGSLVSVVWLMSRAVMLDSSLTETHEVSGSSSVARKTKSRPVWGSRLVVSRALCSLLPWFDPCGSRLLAALLLLLPKTLGVEWLNCCARWSLFDYLYV